MLTAIYFYVVFPIIIISAIVYVVKNTKNPNKNNVVIKNYDFLEKNKEEKNEPNHKFHSNDSSGSIPNERTNSRK